MVSKSKRRKERKRRAAVAGKRAQEEAKRTEESDPSATALNVLANLDDAGETARDLVLVERAIRHRTLTPEKLDECSDRIMEVVRKREVKVVGKDGEVHVVDGPADVNAMKAVDLILKCEAQNQKDEHFEKRQANPKKPSQTQINVGVTIGADERREKLSAIASRIGVDFVPEGGTTSEADGDPEAVVRIGNPQEGDGS